MITALLAATAISFSTPQAPRLRHVEFLQAIAEVESGSNDAAVGKGGERGRYQFTEIVWRSLTELPFEKAHVREIADVIALKHLTNMERRMRRVTRAEWPGTGIPERQIPFLLAVAWNAGESNAYSHSVLPAVAAYANRVVSLYIVFLPHRLDLCSSAPSTPAFPAR